VSSSRFWGFGDKTLPPNPNLLCALVQRPIMNYDNKRIAGLLFFVGAVQFILAVIICEAVYSGYSVGQQFVSDLGDWSKAGNYAAIFNASIISAGLIGIASVYFIRRAFKNRLFTSLLVISDIGNVCVGVVAENISLPVHGISGLVSLIFGLAAMIMSYKFVKSPLSYAPVILGGVTLLAFVLQSSGFYLGLGLGGIERFEI
jgi:hypothetical membrane protein